MVLLLSEEGPNLQPKKEFEILPITLHFYSSHKALQVNTNTQNKIIG